MAIGLPKRLQRILHITECEWCEYLLIEGYAVGYHGYPRATNDIDIWIAMNQENAGKMMKGLKEFGFDTPELSSELFLQKDRMIRLGMPPMHIEVLVEISLTVNRPMAMLRIYNRR